MRRNYLTTLLLSVSLLISGCALKHAAVGLAGGRTKNSISRVELEAGGHSDVYEAVRVLRPSWLRSRVSTGPAVGLDEGPVLYVHGSRFGSVDDLRQFDIAEVEEVRYVHALDATTRWGQGHTNGVIEVIILKRSN